MPVHIALQKLCRSAIPLTSCGPAIRFRQPYLTLRKYISLVSASFSHFVILQSDSRSSCARVLPRHFTLCCFEFPSVRLLGGARLGRGCQQDCKLSRSNGPAFSDPYFTSFVFWDQPERHSRLKAEDTQQTQHFPRRKVYKSHCHASTRRKSIHRVPVE